MNVFFLSIFIALLSHELVAEYCFDASQSACNSATKDFNCKANYSGVHHVMPNLKDFVNEHIGHSYQYLLMSTNFGNYEKNRAGFSKLYKKLSDETWEDAIDVIKYITKRGGGAPTVGGEFRLFGRTLVKEGVFEGNFDLYELESLTRALDMKKTLAQVAHDIHREVSHLSSTYHDAEAASYIEKEFVHKHADSIRELAGYVNDLKNLIKNSNHKPSLAVYLFDEYLQKAL